MSTTDLPIIDLVSFRYGSAATRQAVAADIYHACHSVGFMYLKNCGIAPELIALTMQRSREFFQLPLAIKDRLAISNEFSNRGYVGVARERLDENQPGDLKEAFNIGKELSDASLESNHWLESDVLFRQTMLDFFAACATAARTLSEALALALDLPETFFVDRHDRQDHTLRLLHYPAIKQPSLPQQLRAGEHSDYGSFTLLFQDTVGGLEVLSNSGEWIEAPFIPETVIFNIGDLMQRWTNDLFRSTKHRVTIPKDKRARKSRYAIAFFCHPNDNTEISCLETCQSSNRPSLYPPVNAKDYLFSRLQATY